MAGDIKPGDMVELRTAEGHWIGPVEALSAVRVDVPNAWRRHLAWPSVSVQPEGFDHPINWPADDVREATDDR